MLIEDQLLQLHPLAHPGMMSVCQVRHILRNLREVLETGIAGDVVELGCHFGTTSLFIRRMLDHYASGKTYHVYDSWQGLPEKTAEDGDSGFKKGYCKTSIANFILLFNRSGLTLPRIHSGWFADIPDEEYPEQICFAFFDGDFYTSIMDSFRKVYPRLARGARVLIDDYEHPDLPGCPKACNDFLANKPETIEILKDDTGRASEGLLIKI
jgi:O-methyltransferase